MNLTENQKQLKVDFNHKKLFAVASLLATGATVLFGPRVRIRGLGLGRLGLG